MKIHALATVVGLLLGPALAKPAIPVYDTNLNPLTPRSPPVAMDSGYIVTREDGSMYIKRSGTPRALCMG